jgi:hypothetical protein
MAKILVKNLRLGFPESVEEDVGNQIFTQVRDYEEIPFHCNLCHQ